MIRHQICAKKRNGMRRMFITGNSNTYQAAKEFKVSTVTSWRYMREFKRIQEEYPEKLKDMTFYMPAPDIKHAETKLYAELRPLFPILLSEDESKVLNAMNMWHKYRKVCPNGYSYSAFKVEVTRLYWESVTPRVVTILEPLTSNELKQLKKWKLKNDHRRWQIAVTLIAASTGSSIKQIMAKADCARKSVSGWLKTYCLKGLNGFELSKKKVAPGVIERMKIRKDNLTKLIHETPKIYGLNRTSWSITALTAIYNRIYDEAVSFMQVSYCLRQLGIRYKKSRDMLTSQDPNFRSKINKIQHILQNLKKDEKFFSIDEYGPVSVKIKGGIMLKQRDEAPHVVPEKQKSKGYIICTAALELSTNQVTHFYSMKKNSFEMIKLIDTLVEQYRGQRRLYICWDAVSWHNSKIVKYYLEDLNKNEYRQIHQTPEVLLAPLPSCTQFLNVIESVFGGLAKAVIHNSDYGSVDEAKAAISLHFEARNQHYKENPKHAGKKIWGKEIVVPKFIETQNCRNRDAMRGAK